jgi:hypothetical protein
MQLTIYYGKDDEWLINKLQAKAYAERKSVSAIIMTVLQEYFGELPEERKAQPRLKRGRKPTPQSSPKRP